MGSRETAGAAAAAHCAAFFGTLSPASSALASERSAMAAPAPSLAAGGASHLFLPLCNACSPPPLFLSHPTTRRFPSVPPTSSDRHAPPPFPRLGRDTEGEGNEALAATDRDTPSPPPLPPTVAASPLAGSPCAATVAPIFQNAPPADGCCALFLATTITAIITTPPVTHPFGRPAKTRGDPNYCSEKLGAQKTRSVGERGVCVCCEVVTLGMTSWRGCVRSRVLERSKREGGDNKLGAWGREVELGSREKSINNHSVCDGRKPYDLLQCE